MVEAKVLIINIYSEMCIILYIPDAETITAVFVPNTTDFGLIGEMKIRRGSQCSVVTCDKRHTRITSYRQNVTLYGKDNADLDDFRHDILK